MLSSEAKPSRSEYSVVLAVLILLGSFYILPLEHIVLGEKGQASPKRLNQNLLSPGRRESVAVLVPVSTRGSRLTSSSDLALFKHFLPSFLRTLECDYDYNVFVGYDTNDEFYDTEQGQMVLDNWIKEKLLNSSCFDLNLVKVRVDNHLQKPGPVFNEMAKVAYKMGADYIYRVNDDTELITPWTSEFIRTLKSFGPPYGVVGPKCSQGNTRILTHDFTNSLHMEIFDSHYYPSELTDWWLDDWISGVYGDNRTRQLSNVEVIHHIQTSRYEVNHSNREKLEGLIQSGRRVVLIWIEQHVILGDREA